MIIARKDGWTDRDVDRDRTSSRDSYFVARTMDLRGTGEEMVAFLAHASLKRDFDVERTGQRRAVTRSNGIWQFFDYVAYQTVVTGA